MSREHVSSIPHEKCFMGSVEALWMAISAGGVPRPPNPMHQDRAGDTVNSSSCLLIVPSHPYLHPGGRPEGVEKIFDFRCASDNKLEKIFDLQIVNVSEHEKAEGFRWSPWCEFWKAVETCSHPKERRVSTEPYHEHVPKLSEA
jgi:hypothetical protein